MHFLQSVLHNQIALVVPALWHYEMYNLLVTASRRRRLTDEDAAMAAEALCRVPIRSVEVPTAESSRAAFRLARHHGLSLYDTSYLELSKRLQAPLSTLDKGLEKAALAEGIPLFEAS